MPKSLFYQRLLPFAASAVSISLAFLLYAHPAQALTPSTLSDRPNSPTPPHQNQLIVKFKHPYSHLSAMLLALDPDIRSGRTMIDSRTFIIRIPEGKESQVLNRLTRRSDIEYAELDALAYPSSIAVNDTYFDQQWNLSTINAPEAWSATTGDSAVIIALLDSGVDTSHPDLSAKIVDTINFSDSTTATDQIGHGTHVAGIAAADTNNDMGIAGVGYHTGLLSVKVLSDQGSGRYSWIAEGIYYATDHGARVINLSLGGTSDSTTLRQAVAYAVEKGVVVVAAAGNSGSTRAVYPAYFSEVVAVAAIDSNLQKPYFSNYGSWIDLAAPGVSVLSTTPTQSSRFSSTTQYGLGSGTSMATPHVTGVAALIFSQHPDWSGTQVIEQLKATASVIPNTGRYWKYGLVDAAAAVSVPAPQPSPTPTPTPTPTPSPTPTPTPTPTPSPTPTPTPTPTPSPTPTPTPTPIPSPSPSPEPDPDMAPTPSPVDPRRQGLRQIIDQRICQLFPSRCDY